MSARITACTNCRQTKLKCDVKETQPDACTRCRTRNISCKMDSNFKRVPTRGKLAEVTQKLNSLQEILANDPNHRNLVNADLSAMSGSSSHQTYTRQDSEVSDQTYMGHPSAGLARSSKSSVGTSLPSPSIGNLDIQPRRSCFYLEGRSPSDDPLRIEPKELGGVVVDGQRIGELFVNYYRFRHRFLPMINTNITISELYDTSPFLFWTIMHTSCRHNPEFANLEHRLTAPYKELLATTLITAVTSLQTIQGLLLLSLYPFNIRHQHDEHSLNLCGFTLSACLQMGLHRPDHLHDYGILDISGASIESRMTWMALFQISSFQSLTLGTPPLIQSAAHLEGIRSMCCNPSIPRNFVAQIEIQRHVARYTSTLDGQTDPQSRFSLTQVYDRELETLRTDFADVWSGDAEFNLLIAKLYLYTMYLSSKSEQKTGAAGMGGPYDSTGASKRTTLYLGLAAVVRLVQVFKTQCGYPQTEPTNMFASNSSTDLYSVEFYPKFYFRSLVFAACFLLYFLLTDEQPTPEDEKTARSHIDSIHDIFRAYHLKFVNSSTYDVHRHAAETIDHLRRSMSRESGFARFTVESRMGASVFFGAMKTTREAQRREALRAREAQVHQMQVMQTLDIGASTSASATNATNVNATMQPMELEREGGGDFLWEQQLSAEWNFQWGIRSWEYPIVPEFQFGLGGELNTDMDGFEQP